MSIRYFDMFAGIGGFRSGLDAVGGFECVGYCEIDKYAKQAYEAMYDTKGEMYYEDATTIDPEGLDCQIFRMIWEHKTVMQERMRLVEGKLLMSHELSDNYREIVNEADTLRMLFATHHMKRRDSLLPIIRKRLGVMAKKEKELLLKFTNNLEKQL